MCGCTVCSAPLLFVHNKLRKVAKTRNRCNQVPHLTQDTTWESDKNTKITNKSQEVSSFPAGDHKVAMNRRESMETQDINNTNDLQKKYRLRTVRKHMSPCMRFPTMWYMRPAKPPISLPIRAIWSELEHSMIVKLLTEQHLEFLSLKGGCRGSSSIHLSKCQIFGNLLPRLNIILLEA